MIDLTFQILIYGKKIFRRNPTKHAKESCSKKLFEKNCSKTVKQVEKDKKRIFSIEKNQ